MSTEQMRQEFETAYLLAINEGEEIEITEEDMRNSRRGDEYTGSIASGAWWAWQASRAALVVQLPETFDATHHPLHGEYPCLDPEEVKAVLAAVGLKVAP